MSCFFKNQSNMSTKALPPKKTAGQSAPIDILRNDAARLYTHIHPFLVLGLFAASFKSTVADPVTSIARLTIPLAVIQCVYAVLCIPTSDTAMPSQATNPGTSGSDAAPGASMTRAVSGFRRKGGSGSKATIGSKVIVSIPLLRRPRVSSERLTQSSHSDRDTRNYPFHRPRDTTFHYPPRPPRCSSHNTSHPHSASGHALSSSFHDTALLRAWCFRREMAGTCVSVLADR